MDIEKIWPEAFRNHVMCSCVYFILGHVANQKHSLEYFVSEVSYDVNFTASNNKLNVRSSYNYIWYH